MKKPGLVSLVGAGPGDPGLLTVRGAQRLGAAQALVYDALVQPELLELAPSAARRFFVGKRDGLHEMEQGRINRLLLRLSRRGLRVVRLKGGDPFLFGRGSEEAEALSRAGLPWEAVPGVSSCLAAPAYAGIPVTDRRYASMVTVVSGHACGENGDTADWERVSPRGTLVVLMGVGALPALCRRLLDLGWPPRLPAAALSSMGWPQERVVTAELSTLAEAVRRHGLAAPAVLVFGEVVRLRRWLTWREPKGRREHVKR